jgi:hypothetical protein
MLTRLPSTQTLHLFYPHNMTTHNTYIAVCNIYLQKTDTFFYLMPYQITVTVCDVMQQGASTVWFLTIWIFLYWDIISNTSWVTNGGNKRTHRLVRTPIISHICTHSARMLYRTHTHTHTHATCSCCNKQVFRLKFTDAQIPSSKNNLRIKNNFHDAIILHPPPLTQWCYRPVAYPGIFFGGGGVKAGIFSGGFNKFSLEQRAERTGVWGR